MLFFEFKNENETKYIFYKVQKNEMYVHKKNETLTSLADTDIQTSKFSKSVHVQVLTMSAKSLTTMTPSLKRKISWNRFCLFICAYVEFFKAKTNSWKSYDTVHLTLTHSALFGVLRHVASLQSLALD